MKLELFQDGKLVVSIEPVGNIVSGDFTFLPKELARESTLKAESFDDLFHTFLRTESSNEQAYNKAEAAHFEWFGRNKYSGYESYKSSVTQRRKK